jgi:hypothetical protein
MSDLSIDTQKSEIMEDKRSAQRSRTLQGAKIIIDKNSTFTCQIKTRSDEGFGLKLGNTNGVPDEFKLVDQKTDMTYEVKVVWRKRSMLGVKIVD